MSDGYLTTDEAATIVRLKRKTLEKFRCTGGGPAFLKLGRRVLYRRGDLIAWAERDPRSSTSAPLETLQAAQ